MTVRDLVIGPEKLTIIAGPCMAESRDLCLEVAEKARKICDDLGFQFIFKASFDKANRTSLEGERGFGMEESLGWIRDAADRVGSPCTTDVHESSQAATVAVMTDLLQIPAFLCRQTDLLQACAETGKPVNVKKGQFLAPWDAGNIVEKLRSFKASGIMLTERGTSFGYNALIVDMGGLEVLRSFGVPVCFDATHSAQRPGGGGTASGGNRAAIPSLTRAAVAVGIDALFLELHPDPECALSDAATQWPLHQAENLLRQVKQIWEARKAL